MGRLVTVGREDSHRNRVDEVVISSTCLLALGKHRRWGPGSLISASFGKLLDALGEESF